MDVVQSIWVSSVTGAGLFTAIGLLASRALPRKATVSPEQLAALQGESESRVRTQTQIVALQQKHDDLARQLTEERSQAAELRGRSQNDPSVGEQLLNEKRLHLAARQEAQLLGASVARLEAEAIQLRAVANKPEAGRPTADESAQWRAQLAALQRENQAHRAQLQQRETELGAVRTQLATSESRASMAQTQAQAASVQMQRELAEIQSARARAEAEIAQLREAVRTAGQSVASTAAARAQQLDAKVAELQGKASASEALQREVQQLTAQLTAARTKITEGQLATQQLAAAQARVAQFDARDAQQLAVAQAHAKEAHQLAQQLSAAQAQLRDLRAELVVAEKRTHEVAGLREENGALRLQITELQSAATEAAPGLAEVQRRNVELSFKSRALSQRNQEFEVLATELESLRNKILDLTDEAAEAGLLRKKVRDLEAQGFATKIVRADTWTKRPARDNSGPDRLESLLQNKLESLVMATPGCRTAVLADLRGLLIAASGDIVYQHELAAVASLMTYTTERVRELLPLGEPSAFEMVDVNRAMVRVNWMRLDSEAVLLTTVGLAPAQTEAFQGHTQGLMEELAGD